MSQLCGTRINESPCRVRIVVQGEYALLPVLLKYESCFKFGLFCALRHLHALFYIGPDMKGTEVKLRQVVETPHRDGKDEQRRVVDDNPLVRLAHEAEHLHGFPRQHSCHDEQHYVFPQRLPVGKHQRIAKASTVTDGIGQCQPKCQRRHHHHHEQYQP